jgi:transposase-like protein
MAAKKPLHPPADLTLGQIMAHFSTDEQAREYLEACRWENGRYCPHCGNADESKIYAIKANKQTEVRPGLYQCAECDQQFTVTVGTVFERSKVPLRKWLIAYYLLCTSKKGCSAHQLWRMLDIGSYRTAWFMFHRIRFSMRDAAVFEKMDGTVEIDETFIGARRKRGTNRGRPGPGSHKIPVVTLVQRGGKARSMVVERVTARNLKAALDKHVSPSAHLMTDEWKAYRRPAKRFASHQTVNHANDEYVRGDVHVNTAEGFFSLLKRGINGVYHHVSKQHLGQYLGEFDFRYNTRKMTDGERTIEGIKKIAGKRLMLKRPKAG